MGDRFGREESNRAIARREVRKAGNRSTELAATLMAMPEHALRKLELDENLDRVLGEARRITSKVARRRGERSVAGALRRVDLDELSAQITNVQEKGEADPRLFKLAERWRSRLLDEGPEGIAALREAVPAAAEVEWELLLDKALRERDTGKPPGAARALFRALVPVLKG